MELYKHTCERCCKGFSKKSHLDAHKKKKNVCENTIEKASVIATAQVKTTLCTEPSSFVELYKFLQLYPDPNITGWLEHSWRGKDKQESLLRLFAGLKLIRKLDNYVICKGNFNEGSVEPHVSIKENVLPTLKYLLHSFTFKYTMWLL